MDLTSKIAIRNPPHTEDEAFTVLSQMYPGLMRDGRDYVYRGHRFNHFLSGISMDPAKPNGYMLIDTEDSRLWLHTYGDPEARWQEFVAAKEEQHQSRLPKRRTFWEWLFSP